MIVDTDLLRMGADFSDSAGSIARKGAGRFAATQLPRGIFGDFAEADEFHRYLSNAQSVHAENMRSYGATFAQLGEKSVTAAGIFTNEDGRSAAEIAETGPASD